jgi:hypothetical protein
MTLDTKLEFEGNTDLRGAYQRFVPGSMPCVDKLMKYHPTMDIFRDFDYFYASDGCVYSVDRNVPTLRITREATNPIHKNIEKALRGLIDDNNYDVPQEDFNAVKLALDTVTIDLTKLRLQSIDNEYSFFAISTTEYDNLNTEERRLAERLYGQGPDFVEIMQRSYNIGIKKVSVNVLNPAYVEQRAAKNAIGRMSGIFFASKIVLNLRNYNSLTFSGIDRDPEYEAKLEKSLRFFGGGWSIPLD